MVEIDKAIIIDNIFKGIITIGLGAMAIFLGYSFMMWAINDQIKESKERNECIELAKDNPLKDLSIRCIILISDN